MDRANKKTMRLLDRVVIGLLVLLASLRREWSFVVRNATTAFTMLLLVGLYLVARGGFVYNGHDWNRSFADAAVVRHHDDAPARFERHARRRDLHDRRALARRTGRRGVAQTQVVHRYVGAVGEQHRALDGIFELADVTGPGVAHQQLERIRLGSLELLLQLTGETSNEEV